MTELTPEGARAKAQHQVGAILAKIREVCPELKGKPADLPLPVRYDGKMYFWGKGSEMVADFDTGTATGDGFRIRGWGRIQNEERQNECAYYIQDAINAYKEPHLEHLLRAIRDTSDGYYKLGSFLDWLYVTNVKGDFEDRPTHFTQHFKLDLSVQENLESDESLRDFLYELICKV